MLSEKAFKPQQPEDTGAITVSTHIGGTEPMDAEASTSPSYRRDIARGLLQWEGSRPSLGLGGRSYDVQLFTHTHQVLRLEEPVPELEGLASAPDTQKPPIQTQLCT